MRRLSLLTLIGVLGAAGASCRSCRGTLPGGASPSPTPVTLRLEGDGAPAGEEEDKTSLAFRDLPPAAGAKVSFSELYDRTCPRIAKAILSCSEEKEFSEALLVHIGRSSRKVVLQELKASFVRWSRAGADKTCESWINGFYNAPMLSDAKVLRSVSDATSRGCGTLGSVLAESGGLPELIPAR